MLSVVPEVMLTATSDRAGSCILTVSSRSHAHSGASPPCSMLYCCIAASVAGAEMAVPSPAAGSAARGAAGGAGAESVAAANGSTVVNEREVKGNTESGGRPPCMPIMPGWPARARRVGQDGRCTMAGAGTQRARDAAALRIAADPPR